MLTMQVWWLAFCKFYLTCRISVYYIRNKAFSSNIISISHLRLYGADAWFTVHIYGRHGCCMVDTNPAVCPGVHCATFVPHRPDHRFGPITEFLMMSWRVPVVVLFFNTIFSPLMPTMMFADGAWPVWLVSGLYQPVLCKCVSYVRVIWLRELSHLGVQLPFTWNFWLMAIVGFHRPHRLRSVIGSVWQSDHVSRNLLAELSV